MSQQSAKSHWMFDTDVIHDGMGNCVARVSMDGDDGWHGSTDEAETNGHLLAAAPKLLQALEALVQLADDEGLAEWQAVREAREILAEARG